jgi:hypothetical protein
MAGWEGFRQCPGCGFDFASGEGERSCSWGDCPYLPEELNVFASVPFNFFTMREPALRGPADVHMMSPPHVENMRTGRDPPLTGS